MKFEDLDRKKAEQENVPPAPGTDAEEDSWTIKNLKEEHVPGTLSEWLKRDRTERPNIDSDESK